MLLVNVWGRGSFLGTSANVESRPPFWPGCQDVCAVYWPNTGSSDACPGEGFGNEGRRHGAVSVCEGEKSPVTLQGFPQGWQLGTERCGDVHNISPENQAPPHASTCKRICACACQEGEYRGKWGDPFSIVTFFIGGAGGGWALSYRVLPAVFLEHTPDDWGSSSHLQP